MPLNADLADWFPVFFEIKREVVVEDRRVDLRRIPYDVDRTVAGLRAAPLPADVIDGLVRVLTTGRNP